MDFYLERKHTDDRLDEVISFRGEVRMSELSRLRLNKLDRALLDDVGADEEATPADYLLTLEMIFRRHAEQPPNAGVIVGRLLPCPCCGAPASVGFKRNGSLGLHGWVSDCTVCTDSASFHRFTRDAAIDSWNGYASPTVTPNAGVTRRDRHMMSRYEYLEDRMEFQRWRCAPGPCQRPYWYFDELRGRLTIKLRKADRVMCYDLTMLELEMSRMGWRWLVAQAVRQVRHALAPNAGDHAPRSGRVD